ncbi:uncharacterized protein LOC143039712 [Oratosquilla oratoria]|uniref:uncharacterized protein LOC143039712 n=1 Tax=Oratosquilla oratoria TaxID=337810 RepID=UPI003F75C5A7
MLLSPRPSCLLPLHLCLFLFTFSAAMTFLVVDRNLTSLSKEKPVNATSAGLCGGSCFEAAQEGQCIAFVWREEQEINTSADATSLDGLSSSRGSGHCGLLRCIPNPEDFSPSPGALFYLVVRGNARLPFDSIKAPDSYKVVCTYAYRVYDKLDFTYEEAREKCAKDGARLFAFTNEAQQQHLNDQVNPGVAYWIGMDDLAEEGTFIMSNGQKPGFQNWDKDQPNNYIKSNPKEDQDCVTLWRRRWNDNQCSDKLPFICQIPFLEP